MGSMTIGVHMTQSC